ncbi:hypothetical protein RhiirA4_444492 [Rhizophagus irregularis]|uniref:Uncharacterized protein n=1 Tax=Rhizophagus irregularis TaxID=588596 RepID=A0A2I1GJF4_9GLOM|nr:hypothetical protein RhiirA4_444492 [Rhizophagus irregularis]
MKEREDAAKEKGEKEENEEKAKSYCLTKKKDEESDKEGKKRIIGKQGDRSKVEDEEDSEGEWTTYHGRGKGRVRGVRGRGTRGIQLTSFWIQHVSLFVGQISAFSM